MSNGGSLNSWLIYENNDFISSDDSIIEIAIKSTFHILQNFEKVFHILDSQSNILVPLLFLSSLYLSSLPRKHKLTIFIFVLFFIYFFINITFFNMVNLSESPYRHYLSIYPFIFAVFINSLLKKTDIDKPIKVGIFVLLLGLTLTNIFPIFFTNPNHDFIKTNQYKTSFEFDYAAILNEPVHIIKDNIPLITDILSSMSRYFNSDMYISNHKNTDIMNISNNSIIIVEKGIYQDSNFLKKYPIINQINYSSEVRVLYHTKTHSCKEEILMLRKKP